MKQPRENEASAKEPVTPGEESGWGGFYPGWEKEIDLVPFSQSEHEPVLTAFLSLARPPAPGRASVPALTMKYSVYLETIAAPMASYHRERAAIDRGEAEYCRQAREVVVRREDGLVVWASPFAADR